MADAERIVSDLEARLRPLEVELNRAWWDLNTGVSDEAVRRREELELAVREVLADRAAYQEIGDALALEPPGRLRRQLELLRAAMVPNQLDDDLRRRLVTLETQVEAVYSSHRGEIDGQRLSDNDVAEVLGRSDDVELRRKAWEASKSIGEVVGAKVLELVRLRNEAARSLGFSDHYAMALALEELDEPRLVAVLDELDASTAEPFSAWKAELDAERARRFGCTATDLRPWHYDDVFFQEPPRPPDGGLDRRFAQADLTALTLRTYDGLGIDLRPVVERSDLLPREGKSQHAFCIDVDRQGDVRVLANVALNERWMTTMLHEFGHAAYDCGLGPDLPFLLHQPAHMLTTEAVAMLFGRLVHDAEWLSGVAGVAGDSPAGAIPAGAIPAGASLADAVARSRRAGMLVFARWVLVVVHFERGLYRHPDDDHDRRWWDLVERFQGIRRPDGRSAPDWAAKIHLAVAPVYYQNYLYGELMASQLQASLVDRFGGIVDRPEAGRWLAEAVFRPGASQRWDRLVEAATGEPLSARHFAADCAG